MTCGSVAPSRSHVTTGGPIAITETICGDLEKDKDMGMATDPDLRITLKLRLN